MQRLPHYAMQFSPRNAMHRLPHYALHRLSRGALRLIICIPAGPEFLSYIRCYYAYPELAASRPRCIRREF